MGETLKSVQPTIATAFPCHMVMVLKTGFTLSNRSCGFPVDPDADSGHHDASGKDDLLLGLGSVKMSCGPIVELPKLQLLAPSSFSSNHKYLSTIVLRAAHTLSQAWSANIYHFLGLEPHFLFPPQDAVLLFKEGKSLDLCLGY